MAVTLRQFFELTKFVVYKRQRYGVRILDFEFQSSCTLQFVSSVYTVALLCSTLQSLPAVHSS